MVLGSSEMMGKMESSIKTTEVMTQKIRRVLADALGEDLAAVVHGSYARSRGTEYSDIDLLIAVERQFQGWRERRQLEVELRKALYRSIGPGSPVVLSVDDLPRALEHDYPLILDILETGIVLLDNWCFADLRAQFIQWTTARAASVSLHRARRWHQRHTQTAEGSHDHEPPPRQAVVSWEQNLTAQIEQIRPPKPVL
jgi:predicted nucleotidyltransferase